MTSITVNIKYPIRPKKRSMSANRVVDLFGLSHEEPPLIIADNLRLDVQPADVVLFLGPSGSGKSSLLRSVGTSLNAVDAQSLPLPAVPLVDALPGDFQDRLELLSACGMAEARLMLRTPAELSDGQRARFRLALALAGKPTWIMVDEFAALLDRTLAKVLAFNIRKLAFRSGIGFLLATTHDDVVEDLNPNLTVYCHGEGNVEIERRDVKKKKISFSPYLWLSEGTIADWPYFARWHYRSHRLGFVKRVVLLWHGEVPIGICVFSTPAASLALRSRYFGLKYPRSETAMSALNRQLWVLSRVVLHPTYRGAGIASAFVRRACETCPVAWIETLSAMGQINPFFERAGFVRVGTIRKSRRGDGRGAYGGRLSAETRLKSRYSEPVYYVFDNRVSIARKTEPNEQIGR